MGLHVRGGWKRGGVVRYTLTKLCIKRSQEKSHVFGTHCDLVMPLTLSQEPDLKEGARTGALPSHWVTPTESGVEKIPTSQNTLVTWHRQYQHLTLAIPFVWGREVTWREPTPPLQSHYFYKPEGLWIHNHLFSGCPFCPPCLLKAGCNAQGIFHQHQVDGILEMIKTGLRFAGCQGKRLYIGQDQIAGQTNWGEIGGHLLKAKG